MKKLFLFVTLMAILLVSGCGTPKVQLSFHVEHPSLASVRAMKTRAFEISRSTYLCTGCTLEAVVTQEDGTPVETGTMTYTSDNPDVVINLLSNRIAAVVVNGIASKTATITATFTDETTGATDTKQEVLTLANIITFNPQTHGASLDAGRAVLKAECDFYTEVFANDKWEIERTVLHFPNGGQVVERTTEDPIDLFATNYAEPPGDEWQTSFETTDIEGALISRFYWIRTAGGTVYKALLVGLGEQTSHVVYFLP